MCIYICIHIHVYIWKPTLNKGVFFKKTHGNNYTYRSSQSFLTNLKYIIYSDHISNHSQIKLEMDNKPSHHHYHHYHVCLETVAYTYKIHGFKRIWWCSNWKYLKLCWLSIDINNYIETYWPKKIYLLTGL